MKIAICDDEQIFINILKVPLKTFFNSKDLSISIDEFTNGYSMLDDYIGYDIIFLDVSMPEINGIDLGKKMLSLYLLHQKKNEFLSPLKLNHLVTLLNQ